MDVAVNYAPEKPLDGYMHPGAFVKWREATVTVQLPDRLAARAGARNASIAFSGRNLKLWTNYAGFEPEAMFLGGTRGGNAAWEQTTLPQLASWMVTVNLGF